MLFSGNRVITVNPGTVSQQHRKDGGWLRDRSVSVCDGALQNTDILSDIRLLFTMFLWCHVWDNRNDANITEKELMLSRAVKIFRLC